MQIKIRELRTNSFIIASRRAVAAVHFVKPGLVSRQVKARPKEWYIVKHHQHCFIKHILFVWPPFLRCWRWAMVYEVSFLSNILSNIVKHLFCSRVRWTMLDSRTRTRLRLILIWANSVPESLSSTMFYKTCFTLLDSFGRDFRMFDRKANFVKTSSNIIQHRKRAVQTSKACFIKQCWILFYGDVSLAWTPWNKGLLLTASMTCLFIVGCIVNLQGMEEILECFLNDENPDMTRQIQFIIRQLNTGLVNI